MATYQSNPGNYPPQQQGGYPPQQAPQQGYGQPQMQGNTNTVVVVQQGRVYPTLTPCAATIVLIINIFFPGVGTMIMGCMSGDAACNWICLGFAQLVLAPFIIGWIWAIVTGCLAISNSKPNGDATVVVQGGNTVVV